MVSILRIGLSQTAAPDPGLPPAEAMDQALAARLEEIERAARVGVQLLCFPELCCMPWFLGGPDNRWVQQAWAADGPQLQRVGRAAGLHRCVVVLPFLEQGPAGRLHSSAVVFDADGRLMAVIRRQHLQDAERVHISPGRGAFPVVQTAVGMVAVALGHDRHVPEVTRILGLRGAELMLFPAAVTTDHPVAIWEAEPLAVASQNGCWVGACNRVGAETLGGPDGAWSRSYSGGSYLADARGRFQARASRDREAIIRADLALGRLRASRAQELAHTGRRPDIYSALTE
jgi:beta-ureidopropionase